MEKKEIFRKVGTIMNELNEQYQYLSEKPENLNDLELELFLANSNFLTDHIEILRKLNGYNTPATTAFDNQPKYEEPAQESPAQKPSGTDTLPLQTQDTLPTEHHVDHAEAPEETPEPTVETPGTESIEDIDTTEKREDHSVEPEIREEVPAEQTAVKPEQDVAPVTVPDEVVQERPLSESAPKADETSAVVSTPVAEEIVKEVVIPEKTVSVEAPVEEAVSKPTINDMISAQVNASTVAKQFTKQPVADLKSIISLNDKLLFIKDLFNGYSLAYSEAIELLNRFDSFESADNFLKVNYAVKNNWNAKESTVEKLYEILNRRFAK